MSEPTIICPQCKSVIKLNGALSPYLKRLESDFAAAKLLAENEIVERRSALAAEKLALDEEKLRIQETLARRLQDERDKIEQSAAERANAVFQRELDHKDSEIHALNEVLKRREVKLAEAQAMEAKMLKSERELEDAKREVERTVELRVREIASSLEDRARRHVEDNLMVRVTEKEEKIRSMQHQIDILRQKAEQGSQQLQGEAQELVLERLLEDSFVTDQIQSVAKGERGGDFIQRVVSSSGVNCGSIVWEAKRTRTWNDAWLGKLREDTRAAGADVAVLVSRVLPKSLEGPFGLIDGIWVTDPRSAVPLAVALRESLIAISRARQATDGAKAKSEVVYRYLTGPRFRQRVEAIVERFTEMHADLTRERKAMNRLWAKRDAQIRGVIETTAGIYGDLEGIVGKTLEGIGGSDAILDVESAAENPAALLELSETD